MYERQELKDIVETAFLLAFSLEMVEYIMDCCSTVER